jgi:K+:H+ antiporter
MEQISVLRDLVILVAMAVPVVAITQRYKVPSVVGFLATGVLVGPNGWGWIAQADSVSGVAHLGAALLLFAIGLELSLTRIVRLGRLVVQAGGFQLAGTMVVAALVLILAGRRWNESVFLGALVALSSTTIVLKVLHDRVALDTPYGRVAVAVLLFQDLAVVPLLILVPLLASGGTGGVHREEVERLAIGLSVVLMLFVAGRWIVPWVLDRIVGLRNQELFTLCIGFFGLSTAFVTSSLGLSLEIGAFMAGLIVSESKYGLHALSDVLPFKDAFSGIFFMSVGMLLNVGSVWQQPWLVLGSAGGILVLKTGVVTILVRALRRSWRVSLITGLTLAQVGEFSFILAGPATASLLSTRAYQIFLGAAIVSMIAAPFVIKYAAAFAEWAFRDATSTDDLPPADAYSDHAIVVGYGLHGMHLTRVLKASGFPYVVLEQNGQTVRVGRMNGEPLYFGDGTRREVLRRAGIATARVVVFSIASPNDEKRGVANARELNPRVHILVRTRFVAAIEELLRLGASEVVVDEFEATLELFARVLDHYEIPEPTIHEELAMIRAHQYGLLRDDSASDSSEPSSR